MREQKRIFLLIGLMILATGVVGVTVFVFLYGAAMSEERGRLTETVKSQARLIESIARHDMAYKPHLPGGPIKATVARIADAHQKYDSFGKTGTFTLARREGDHIVFLLVHSGQKMVEPVSVPWDSNLVEPMRRALSGHSGTIIGRDYRGQKVLAAYEPVAVLDLGIVAKIDLAEIRAPFLRAGFLAGLLALVVSFGAAYLFVRITRPMIARIEDHARDLEKTVLDLEQSEELSRRMIERNPDTVLILDTKGKILFANPASENLFGRSREAMLGICLGLPSIDEEFSEITVTGLDGSVRTVEMRSQTIQWAEENAFIISLRDLTDRVEAADHIKRLNEALRAIRDVNQLITREKDAEILIRSACEILNAGNRFRGVWVLLLNEDRKVVRMSHAGMGDGFVELQKRFERGAFPGGVKRSIDETEIVVLRKGREACEDCPLGTDCAGEGVLLVPLIQDGRQYGILALAGPFETVSYEEDQGLFREAADDIAFALKSIETEEKQRRYQEALRQSEARFRLLVENAPVGILVVDRDGLLRDCNDGGLEVLHSISSKAALAENLLTLPQLLDAGIAKDVKKCLETGDRESCERPCITEKGGKIFVRYHLAPLRNVEKAISAVQLIMEDVTATKGLESQLRQAQKMEAIGTLAGGIAHDFNNILTAILGYSQLFQTEISEDSKFYLYVKQILKAGERARDLVKQILTFSRQAETEPIPLRPHLIVKEAVKLLRSIIPTTVDIQQHIFPDTGMILADPTQIHQVVMNLCTNVYQAMLETGGVLEITLKSVEIHDDDDFLNVCTELKAGPYVRLTVKDTGIGIGPHALEHIFDPYFTTKEKGRGTGLGLAVVHGIVVDCLGGIAVESEEGAGTSFDIFFPRLEDERDIAAEEIVKPVTGGNERILMVDDEETIAYLGKQMLEKHGYEVETSVNSLETLYGCAGCLRSSDYGHGHAEHEW